MWAGVRYACVQSRGIGGRKVCCICTYHTGGGKISEGRKGSEKKVNGGAMRTNNVRREETGVIRSDSGG